jgi:hypothetical protein
MKEVEAVCGGCLWTWLTNVATSRFDAGTAIESKKPNQNEFLIVYD